MVLVNGSTIKLAIIHDKAIAGIYDINTARLTTSLMTNTNRLTVSRINNVKLSQKRLDLIPFTRLCAFIKQ